MLSTFEHTPQNQTPAEVPYNNRPLPSFAVRGIGHAGLDLVATTITALHAADALAAVIRNAGAQAMQVRAWVVTRL